MVHQPIQSVHAQGDLEPLHSDFRAEDGMPEIIALFLKEIPARIDDLTRARGAGQHILFRRLVHQIKGAGGGYGFPAVSQAAIQLERCIDASADAWVECSEPHFQSLLNLMHRAHAGLRHLQQ